MKISLPPSDFKQPHGEHMKTQTNNTTNTFIIGEALRISFSYQPDAVEEARLHSHLTGLAYSLLVKQKK